MLLVGTRMVFSFNSSNDPAVDMIGFFIVQGDKGQRGEATRG